MKILMLVNWKVEYSDSVPEGKQPPDYFVWGKPYWFFRYFKKPVEVDVLDIRSFLWLENFEKEKLRFYVIQELRAIFKLGRYDMVISHGMQSGVVISLFRRMFQTRAKHIVFDIGSFNSGAESGNALKMMQFASKSIDGLIYHTSSQIDYYNRFFPWIVSKAQFIKFGADVAFFGYESTKEVSGENAILRKDTFSETMEKAKPYILCVGYGKRDWDTLCRAFDRIKKNGYSEIKLKLIGKEHVFEEGRKDNAGKDQIETMPYLPIQQLIEEIKGACFCVVPLESFNYSFGQMTLLQQMALGKAVIAARVPSLMDYGREEETVLYYAPKDEIDLSRQMERLIQSDELRKRLGTNAAYSIRNEYSEQRMAENIEEYLNGYNELIQ